MLLRRNIGVVDLTQAATLAVELAERVGQPAVIVGAFCNRSGMTVTTVDIEGVTYVPMNDLLTDIGVKRQTLWRWRRGGRIPQGVRYRGHQLLFTPEQAELVREFANRIEPARPPPATQHAVERSEG